MKTLIEILRETTDANQAYKSISERIALIRDKNQRVRSANIKNLVNMVEPTTGKTAIHLATEAGNLEIVRLLLSYDANIAIKDKANKSVIDYVITETKEGKKIRALLASRGRLQQQAQNQHDFSINRTLGLIEEAFNKIAAYQEVQFDPIIFFGKTGTAKSTLINFLLGIDYRKVIDPQDGTEYVLPVSPEACEFAKTSYKFSSQTLYPELFPDLVNKNCYVDTQGHLDNRGLEAKICAGVSTYFLRTKLKFVKTIAVVCSGDSIKDPRKVDLLYTLEKLGRMIGNNPINFKSNIVFIVTKPDTNVHNPALIYNNLQGLYAEYNFATNESDPEEFAIKCAIEAITQDQIVIVDKYDPSMRVHLLKKLHSEEMLPISELNFAHYHQEAEKFKSFLEEIHKFREHLKIKLEKVRSALCQEWLSKDIKEIESNFNKINVSKLDLGGLSEFAKSQFAELFKSVSAMEAQLNSINAEIKSLSNSLAQDVNGYITSETYVIGNNSSIDADLEMCMDELDVNAGFFAMLDDVAKQLGMSNSQNNSRSEAGAANANNRNGFFAPNFNAQPDQQQSDAPRMNR